MPSDVRRRTGSASPHFQAVIELSALRPVQRPGGRNKLRRPRVERWLNFRTEFSEVDNGTF